MNGTRMICDLCKKEIPLGAAYVCINYHIENMERDPITRGLHAQVISADQIFTMCGKCGNRKGAEAVKQVLKTTLATRNSIMN